MCAQGKMYCKISLYGQLSKKKLCTYSVNNFDYVILYPFPSKFKYLSTTNFKENLFKKKLFLVDMKNVSPI